MIENILIPKLCIIQPIKDRIVASKSYKSWPRLILLNDYSSHVIVIQVPVVMNKIPKVIAVQKVI